MNPETLAARQKKRAYWRAYLYRTGRPSLIDAGPVREHITKLIDAGMSCQQIGEIAGVHPSGVRNLWRGRLRKDQVRPQQVRRDTHDAILGVSYVEPDKYGARVSTLGARRRIEALRADGFSIKLIGQIMGMPTTRVHHIASKANYIFASTHQQIADAYDRVGIKNPEDFGPVHKQGIANTKAYAVKHGYAPRHCWDPDTIDDPDAVAEWTGECGTANGYRLHSRRRVPVCEPCRTAHSAYNMENRRAQRARERGEA